MLSEIKRNRRLRPGDWFDLATIATTHGLSDGFSNILVPVLVLIVADLGLSTFEAGVILSVKNVATLLFLYPLSLIADITGRKKEILILGLSVSAIAYAALQFGGTFASVVVLAFVAGAGNAAYHPCGTALTASRFVRNKAAAISIHSLGGNIGTSLMPLVQAAVVAAIGWRAAVGVCALPAAVLLPLIGLRFPGAEKGSGRAKIGLRGRLGLLTEAVGKNRNVVLLALIYALKGMGSKGMIGFLPLLASQRFSMDTTTIGVAVSTYFTVGIVAKPLMGFLYNRWGARSALLVPLALSSLLVLAMGLVPWRAMFIPLAALVGAVSPISPIILTATVDLCDEHALASSVGFIYTCHGLGFLSPLIGGLLAEWSGLTASYLFFALATLAAAGAARLLPGVTARSAASVLVADRPAR